MCGSEQRFTRVLLSFFSVVEYSYPKMEEEEVIGVGGEGGGGGGR